MLSGNSLSLLLFGIFLYYSYAISITNWSRNRYVENQRLTTIIDLKTVRSNVECAVECANTPPCMSYSYNSGNKTCLLYSIPFTTETTGTVVEDGWKSYNSMCDNGSKALDYFYQPNNQMCYHLETYLANVTEAMSICSVSGRLLRIDTIEKQAHIVEFLNSSDPELVYIGGTSENRDNIFLYEDGTPLTLFFWRLYNPKGRIALAMQRGFNYKWVNVHANVPRPFLCEIVL